MLGETKTQELLNRVIQTASENSSIDETEVLFLGLEEALTRFANNEIHQNVAETNFGLIVRTALGKRVAEVSTSDTSDAGIQRALEQAETLARIQPENPEFPGFTPPPTRPEDVTAYDEATAGATPEMRAQAVGDVIRYALDRDVNASGAFRTARYEWAVANSHGLFAHQPLTVADLVIVAMTETSSGYADEAAWRVDRIDVAARGREAVDKALRSQHPRPLEAGEYPVVLEPYAAADILAFVGRAASAMSVHEGRSWMSGRQGEQLMDDRITIEDAPRDPDLWPMAFDFEGMPRQAVTIVRDGVTGDAVYDRLWAEKTGHRTTGHAMPSFNPFSPAQAIGGFGPMPLHLTLAPGDGDVEAMVQDIDRGLYVTRFNYTRVVHPREVVITGLTRDGTFWIEGGEIAYPVQNLRFTQSYVAALNDVAAVGATPHTARGYFTLSRAPALSLGSFRFTGTTQF